MYIDIFRNIYIYIYTYYKHISYKHIYKHNDWYRDASKNERGRLFWGLPGKGALFSGPATWSYHLELEIELDRGESNCRLSRYYIIYILSVDYLQTIYYYLWTIYLLYIVYVYILSVYYILQTFYKHLQTIYNYIYALKIQLPKTETSFRYSASASSRNSVWKP
jgi:hypothetical protein